MATHKLLIPIHTMSQKRLNGRPKTIGITLSHHGTEKHMPMNGIKPNATALADGFCMLTGSMHPISGPY